VLQRPEEMTIPKLYYLPPMISDGRGGVISRRTVDARRSIKEIEALATRAAQLRKQGVTEPIVAFIDNRLLFIVGSDVADGEAIKQNYRKALKRLHKLDVILCGYLDAPQDSRQIMRLIHLMSIPDDALADANLRSLGPYEAITDIKLLHRVLQPGQRSAVMVQNSPANYEYQQEIGPDYEIAFFYVKVGQMKGHSRVARVDLPVWVARDRAAVDVLHGMVLQQCNIQASTPYPYAITRADELAYVSGVDKQKLDELIRLELRKHDAARSGITAKLRTKQLARGERRRHELK
jgi:hypothetical protein